jgi:hypothetical protein
MFTSYDEEKNERSAAIKSFMEIWDREHPNAEHYRRVEIEAAFLFGHMSAHQDMSNRRGLR